MKIILSRIFVARLIIVSAIILLGALQTLNFVLPVPHEAQAAINLQINYQGKLTNSSYVAVADGDYNIEFKLYDDPTAGSTLWTETRTGANKVTVTNGLFSVMLGSVTSLASVDFNQTVYLGVNIGGTGTPSWDGEMTPRKTVGSVPSAFLANGVVGTGGVRNTIDSATALTIAKSGSNYALQVDTSTASAATGLKVTSAAAAGGIALAAISSGTNENLTLDAKGSGTISLGSSSTGDILFGGGVGSTGCTVTNSSGALACTSTISSGVAGGTIGGYNLSGNTSGTISILPQAAAGTYNFNLPTTAGASGYILTSGGGGASPMTWTDPSGLGVRWNSIAAPTGNASIAMGSYTTDFTFNSATTGNIFGLSSSSLTTGNLANLASTSTAAGSNTQTVLNVATSGANGTSTQTTYGAQFANTHTGTSSTNVAAYFTASGGTNNYAAIFNAGNVGIGDASPAALLTVGSGDLFQVASNGNLTSSNAGTWTFSNDTDFALTGGTNGLSIDGTTFSVDGASNRVGIGTTSPGYTLQVTSPANAYGFVNTDGTRSVGTYLGTSGAYIGTISNHDLQFFTNSGATSMTLDTSGRLGIGTAPSYRLDVSGQARIGSSYATSYQLSVQTAGATSWIEILNSGGAGKGAFFGMSSNDFQLWNYQAGIMSFYTGTSASTGTERMRIANSGEVGVNTAGPDRRLDILDQSGPQLRLTYTDSTTYADLQSPSTGGLIVTANNLATTGTAGLQETFTIGGSGAGQTYYGNRLSITNSQITNANTLYGQYISFTDAGSLANTVTGLYVDATTANGSDTTYSAVFQGGNVGIGDTTPAAALTVGSGDLFQVNSSGAIAAVVGITSAGGTVSLNDSSNFGVSIAGGTSTGTITLGGTGTQAIDIGAGVGVKTITIGNANDDTFSIASSGLDVSTGGALTNAASYNGLVITANTGVVTTGTWNGTAVVDTYVADTLTVDSSSSVHWNALNNYPAACSAGSAISQLADTTNTCTAFNTDTSITLQDAYGAGNSIETAANTSVVITETTTGAVTGDLLQLTVNQATGGTYSGDALQITMDGFDANSYTGNGVNIVIDQSQNTGSPILVQDDAAVTLFQLSENGAITLGAASAETTAITITDTDYTNALSIGDNNIIGTTSAIDFTNFDVSSAGAIVGVGVNSGTGLIQGTGGLTLTGAISVTNNGSSTIDLNTGTSTGLVTIGGGSGTFSLQTTNIDISSAGAIAGATGISSSGTIAFSGLSSNGAVYTSGGTGTLTTTAPTSGTLGYWSRSGTTISPATSADSLSVPGTGTASEKFGAGSSAAGTGSIAIGNTASAQYAGSISIGYNSTQTNAAADGYGVAIGNSASVGYAGVALGNSTLVAGNSNIAIGTSAQATSPYQSVAIGAGAKANATFGADVAVGFAADGKGSSAVAIGGSSTGAGYSVVIGQAASAGNSTSNLMNIAIGQSASISSSYSGTIVLGTQVVATASAQFIAGSSGYPIDNVYFGKGAVNATPTAYTINGTGGSGTDIAGAALQLAGGKGTGNAAGGDIIFQTSTAGASGTTLQSLATKMTIQGSTGNVGIGTTGPVNKLDVNGGMAIGTYAGVTSAGANNLIISGRLGIGASDLSSYYINYAGGSTQWDVGGGSFRIDNGYINLSATGLALYSAGAVSLVGSGQIDTSSGGQHITLKLLSGASDGASAVGTYIDTAATYSTAGSKLLSIRNNTTEKAFVGYDGQGYFAGSVGINTTGPDRKLDILDASNPQLRLTYTDGSVYSDLQSNSSGDLVMRTTGDNFYMLDNSLANGAKFALSDSGNNEALLDLQVYRAGVYTSRFKVNQFGQVSMGTSGTYNGVDNVGVGVDADAKFEIGGNFSSNAWGLNGIQLQASAGTYTDSNTAVSGTATNAVFNSFAQPTLAATNATVTTTNAATVYIANAPTAGTNQTITNAYALWVDDGNVRFDGNLTVTGTCTGCGGALTPWTSDVDADGYDLNDISNILFRETTGAPTGTDVGLFRDNAGDLNINALSTKSINLQVAGADEYNFSSTALAMNSNNITGVGTAITATAGLTITATSANLALVTATSGNITLAPASTGSVQITSGVTTGTTTTSGLSLAANSVNSGTGAYISTTALTSGNSLQIQGSGATMTTGGELIDLVLGANTVGAGMTITSTGVYTGTGAADGLINIVANSLSTGYGSQYSFTGLSSGTGLLITGGTSMTTNGELLDLNMGAATAGNGLNIRTTGVYTGTGLQVITANSATTGTIQATSATGLTTGRAQSITLGTALTTGGALSVSGASYLHTGAETGSLMSLAYTDASSNAAGAAVTNGILLSPTINTTASAGSKTINGISIAPTYTACGTTSGTCAYNGITQTTAAVTQTTTNALTIIGSNLATAGALVQNTAAGSITWVGQNIQMPNITQTTGTVTSTGIKITGGTVTSGTSYALTTDLNAGLVGFGTTTPDSYDVGITRAVVLSTASSGLSIISGTASYGALYFGDGTDGSDAAYRGGVEYYHSTDSMKIWAGANSATPNLFLTSSGTVGIGTTGPDRKLDVLDASNPQIRLTQADGTVYGDLQSTTTANLIITGDSLTSSSAKEYGLQVSSTINQTSTASYTALDINVTETAATTANGLNRLADFKVGGSSKLAVANNGAVTLQNAASLTTAYGGFGKIENHLSKSEEFDHANWTKSSVTAPTANTQVSPDGSTTAESLATSGSGGYVQQDTSTAVSSTDYTFSVWARSASGTQSFSMRVDGTSTGTGTEITHTATTSWQRFSVTQAVGGFTGNVRVRIYPGTSASTGTIYAWGAQVEKSSVPNTYAKTTTAGLTNDTSRGLVVNNNMLNTTASGYVYGGRQINTIDSTTAGTHIGQFIRMLDNTSLDSGQNVRGLEVQAYSGTNVNGTNTGIASYGYTFGIQAATTAQAAAQASPAAIFADLDNGTDATTKARGNAIRAYTDNATSADLVSFYQETSTYTGNGLLMNFGNGGGSFSGNFMNLQNAATSKYTISSVGRHDFLTADADNVIPIYINSEESTVTQTLFAIESDTTGNGQSVDTVKAHFEADGSLFVSLTGTQNTTALCHANNGQTNNDEIVDCSGAPSDVAEYFGSEDPTLTAGEIVVVGKNATEMHLDGYHTSKAWIARSTGSYQDTLMGVISTAPAAVYGDEIFSASENPRPVALVGRVPVKVNLENGPIKAGDFITSSSTPGVGMKATKSGPVIGQALDKYDGNNEIGTIIVFIKPTNYNGVEIDDQLAGLQFDFTGTEEGLVNSAENSNAILEHLLSQLPSLDPNNLNQVNTDIVIAGGEIITPTVTTQTLRADFLTSATAEGGLEVASTTMFNGGLLVDSISSIGDLLSFSSDVEFFGTPYFTADTAGFAVVQTGAQSVDVVFGREYLAQPIVSASISFEQDIDQSLLDQEARDVLKANSVSEAQLFLNDQISYVVTNKSKFGFTIVLNKPATRDIKLSWVALAVRNATTFMSLEGQEVNPNDSNSGDVAGDFTPDPVLDPVTPPDGSGDVVVPEPDATPPVDGGADPVL